LVGTPVGDNGGELLSTFVGISDALIMGLLLRPPVGFMVGLVLGFKLGLPDGLSVGLFEGLPLGETLGEALVPSVGTIDGLLE